MPDSNGRVTVRELIEQRFDSLDKRLDEILPDHEKRIRSLEKREPWRTAIEGIAVLGGVIGTALGLNK